MGKFGFNLFEGCFELYAYLAHPNNGPDSYLKAVNVKYWLCYLICAFIKILCVST